MISDDPIRGVQYSGLLKQRFYKLVRFNSRNIRKLSTGKITLAGEKQIFRRVDDNGMLKEDIIGLRDDVAFCCRRDTSRIVPRLVAGRVVA